MEDQVIKCDIDFGLTEQPVYLTKESPSHQSDSGCSDMSDVRWWCTEEGKMCLADSQNWVWPVVLVVALSLTISPNMADIFYLKSQSCKCAVWPAIEKERVQSYKVPEKIGSIKGVGKHEGFK